MSFKMCKFEWNRPKCITLLGLALVRSHMLHAYLGSIAIGGINKMQLRTYLTPPTQWNIQTNKYLVVL